jgi:general secretion pathway protein D
VDERTSTVVITDRPEKVEKIASLISTLDTKTKQILIETKMIETTLSDEQKLGIDWQYQTPETRPQEHRRDLRGDFSQSISTGGIFKIGMLGKEEYAVTLEMLRDTGNTNIIANPSLITLNNQTAKIVVGTEYPVATYQLVRETGTYEITGWDFLEYGITVEVTPVVNEDGFITMTIHPEISDAVGIVGGDPHERPIIETQEVTTQTMIKDGETIVIAGLLKDRRRKSVKKIPLLGSIPIIGLLFRKTTDETSKTNLLIFITAHVIESGKESVDITSKSRAQKQNQKKGRGMMEDSTNERVEKDSIEKTESGNE